MINGRLEVRSAAAAAAKSLQSCPTLCDPIDGSPTGSPVPGILQARTLEWVAISFSNAWKWKVKVKSLSRVQLLATPWTAAYQAPPSMGFSRQEYWSGVPLPCQITFTPPLEPVLTVIFLWCLLWCLAQWMNFCWLGPYANFILDKSFFRKDFIQTCVGIPWTTVTWVVSYHLLYQEAAWLWDSIRARALLGMPPFDRCSSVWQPKILLSGKISLTE